MYARISDRKKDRSYFKWWFDPTIILTYTPYLKDEKAINNEFGSNENIYESEVGAAYGCDLSRNEYYRYVKNGKMDLISFLREKLTPFVNADFNHYYRNLYDKIYMSVIKSLKFTDTMTESEIVRAYIKVLENKKYIDIDIYDCIVAAYFLRASKITHIVTKETKRIIYSI